LIKIGDAAMQGTSQTHVLMGQRIRDLRKQRNMTLQDVADDSGVAVSTISKIERGQLAPTYDRFAKIAAALNVEVTALHSDTSNRFEEGSFLVARAGDHVTYENDTYTYEVLFTGALGKSMLPALCKLKPLEEMTFDDHVRHVGQEFVFVLSGKVTIHLEGKPPVLLSAGDSAYFDSSRGHLYSATDAGGARVLFLHAPWPNSTMEKDLMQAANKAELSTSESQ